MATRDHFARRLVWAVAALDFPGTRERDRVCVGPWTFFGWCALALCEPPYLWRYARAVGRDCHLPVLCLPIAVSCLGRLCASKNSMWADLAAGTVDACCFRRRRGI